MGVSRETDKAIMGTAAGGSVIAAIAGIAAIVLAILGLIGMAPALLLSVTTIVVGVALLFEGGSIAARLARLTTDVTHRADTEFVGEGMAVESLGGLVGIVLGILALIGITPIVLLAASAIVFGVSLIVESGANARLNRLMYSWGTPEEIRLHQLAGEAVAASSGAELLFGLGGIVLGILALIGYAPVTLVFVSLLCFGCAVLLSGSSVAGKMMSAFNR